MDKLNAGVYTIFITLLIVVATTALMFYVFPPFGLSGTEFFKFLWIGIRVHWGVPGDAIGSTVFSYTQQEFAGWQSFVRVTHQVPWYNLFYWDMVLPVLFLILIGVVILKQGMLRQILQSKTGSFGNSIRNLKSSKHRSRVKRKSESAGSGIYLAHIGRKLQYASIEDRILVFGPPGTGKTAYILHCLIQWIRQQRTFVVIDIKSSAKDQLSQVLQPELQQAGYEVQVVNPMHPEKGHYNPLDDTETAEAIAELTACLVPDDGLGTQVFTENSRNLVEAIVAHLSETQRSVSLPDVYRFLAQFDSVENLLGELTQSSSMIAVGNAKVMGIVAQSDRLMGSIFATLVSSLKVFQYDQIAQTFACSDFSLKTFGRGKPIALFLQFEEERLQTTGKLLSLMVGHVLQHLIEFSEGREPVLFVAEEIGNCPMITGLREKLNTVRSRHIPFMMSFQTLGQMDKYGAKSGEGAAYIMASADCKMTFRLNDFDTQTAFSNLVGQFEKQYVTRSKTYHQDKVARTRTATQRVEQIVRPADLGKLKPFEVVLMVRGESTLAKAVPYFKAYPQYRWH